MIEQKVPNHIYPKIASIIATYRCTAQCHHCCFECGPEQKDELPLERIDHFIEQISVYNSLKVICFTGGECLLLGEPLLERIEAASKIAKAIRLVTNGFWGKDYMSAEKLAQNLKKAGTTEMSVSTGDSHLEYVKMPYVINAIEAALNVGIEVNLTVEMFENSKVNSQEIIKNERIKTLLKDFEKKMKIYESPWMPLSYSEKIQQKDQYVLTQENAYQFKGCNSIFNTIGITPENDITVCCGLSRKLIPELNYALEDNIGNILQKAGEDFIKIWIFVDGPERIIRWAAGKNKNIIWENLYAHRCQACLALYKNQEIQKTIKEFYEERVDEVLLKYRSLVKSQKSIQAVSYL